MLVMLEETSGGARSERIAADEASERARTEGGVLALSPREAEVLRLIAEGESSKSIAERLGIAPSTVDTYRRQIMDKVNLRTIAELTKYAVRAGLTKL